MFFLLWTLVQEDMFQSDMVSAFILFGFPLSLFYYLHNLFPYCQTWELQAINERSERRASIQEVECKCPLSLQPVSSSPVAVTEACLQ